jgi:hypothetical protein
MLARDIKVESAEQHQESFATTVNDVFIAPTVPLSESRPIIAAQDQAAEAAKSALFEAYKKTVLSL